MKYKWINKQGNNSVIVFFNGWGMDESVISHLNCSDFDIIMFYDYNTIESDFDFNSLNNYQEKYLIAWSMGVMCATLFPFEYTRKIAINGTLYPIDNKFGIPERVYDITIKGFTEQSSKKFINNMFLDEIVSFQNNRMLENQKSELIALKNYKADINFKYDKIFISSQDKIIPTKNQVAFWQQEPNIEAGHCLFYKFSQWSDFL